MTNSDTQHGSISSETQKSTHEALPRKAQRDRLYDQKCRQLRGEQVEPRGHLEIVLCRIQPEPTPLYEIQQNPTGKGFISDVQARIYYLREKFGFNIENRIDRSTKPAMSFYWLTVESNGLPKMNAVEYAPEKTGRPKTSTQTKSTPPEPTLAGEQSGLFGDTSAQVQKPWRDPELEGRF